MWPRCRFKAWWTDNDFETSFAACCKGTYQNYDKRSPTPLQRRNGIPIRSMVKLRQNRSCS
ncbi:hypothetical protein L915_02378 [Phytophthora nicotianae]|uniref:Uncharacterized protein n=1 Tax=Phytophthora nicotianae TaxID=4792 RepID=W2HHJ5_PHYNI|nr:hypothetical protein L915_02378 [Phytophthora nicotianae]ETL47986.1 hypothetical protein L916_02350 [Phytophthora nicotianae]ETM54275.1 hypothetical protein L914_02372 [Phytophthora nicotianae]